MLEQAAALLGRFTQSTRLLRLTTVLGKDELLAECVRGSEYPAILLFVMFTSSASACTNEQELRDEAMRALYSDSEIVNYVCVTNSDCTFDDFAAGLSINPVSLNKAGANGIQIEPKLKGKQFFSSIFLRDSQTYRMIFPPETTFSGVKILKDNTKLMYPVLAIEREASGAWKEYKFLYNVKRAQYFDPVVNCFKTINERKVAISCD